MVPRKILVACFDVVFQATPNRKRGLSCYVTHLTHSLARYERNPSVTQFQVRNPIPIAAAVSEPSKNNANERCHDSREKPPEWFFRSEDGKNNEGQRYLRKNEKQEHDGER